jgi:hypothetical protein
MPIAQDRLQAAVEALRRRPGHSNVMGLVRELCVVGLDIPDDEVNFEIPVPEVRGRMDARTANRSRRPTSTSGAALLTTALSWRAATGRWRSIRASRANEQNTPGPAASAF